MIETLAPGQVVAARYELLRPLAAGHDADTWLARDRTSDRSVVLRRWRGTSDRGARVHASVRHPALLSPIAQETAEDGSPVDVMEYLAGGEIGRLRGRPWPLLARRLLPVVDALAELHAAGWVHGDIKTANVLLDDEGLARLADFGSARRIGEAAAAGASPYSMSPERLDGAPAAIADDVYAFGVLLYELVSGHPPFYPDLTPRRVRDETPAPPVGRPAPPEALVALIARCLAKDPAARPGSMREIRAALEHSLSLQDEIGTAPGTAAGTFTPRPPSEALPIRAEWRRPDPAGPTPAQLRREGFRRGLLVAAALLALAAFGFTFFVLPDLVASRAPAPAEPVAAAPPAAAAPAPAPAPEDFARLAEQKREAERLREPLPGRLEALGQRDVEQWGGPALARGRAALGAGDAAMETRAYGVAIEQFTALGAALDELEQRLPRVVEERLAAAREAFDAGRSAQAAERFEAVLRVDASNQAAKTGLARAKVLDEVLRETGLAQQAEQTGDRAAALAAYRRALALDPAAANVRASIARLESAATGEAYATALAQAQAALARGDATGAEAAYQRAARIRPGTSEVADGLQQLRRAGETRALASTLEQAGSAERAERWSDALNLYREALKSAPTLLTAQQGVERVEPRAMLDAELQTYLERPERLYSPAGRQIARNILERAARTGTPGPRLQGQLARLDELLAQAEQPIRVALASDNATEVQIYRVGKLGSFEQKDLELMPGRYTVVGTRQGYRDVRKELHLAPGSAPPTLDVRCEERI